MQRPVTRFDLENCLLIARLQGKWKNFCSADVYTDNLTILYPHEKSSINSALSNLVEILQDALVIRNDTEAEVLFEGGDTLPVYWQEMPQEDCMPEPYALRPLLQDTTLLTEDSAKEAIDASIFTISQTDEALPKITAFFSFKGGVGRTLHLTAMTKYLATELKSEHSAPKILLIDADIEAPGITWWAKEELPAFEYSFLDLLADELDNPANSAEKAAKHIRSIRLQLGSSKSTCFFLPAFRTDIQLLRPPVLPERLALAGKTPWAVGNLLRHTGKMLGVNHIIVDLRAGLTELSSPIFLDPFVNRILVTTTSHQSLYGTKIALGQLSALSTLFSVIKRKFYFDSTQVILGFIPPEADENKINAIEQELITELAPLKANDNEDTIGDADGSSWIIRSKYDQSLLGLADFKSALLAMDSSSTLQGACKYLAESILENTLFPSPGAALAASSEGDWGNDVKKLQIYCENLTYAEQQDPSAQFLVTDSYRKLTAHFINKAANAVILGAKGSGKTFFLKKLTVMENWSQFCLRCGTDKSTDALLIPVLWSKNETQSDFLKSKMVERLTKIGAPCKPEEIELLQRKLSDGFAVVTEKNPNEWREYWYEFFCYILNAKKDKNTTYEQCFKKKISEQNHPMVILMDGLEDIFANWIGKPQYIVPLQILLQEIVKDISTWSKNRVGLLIFIRKDIARAAFTQNAEQFFSLYRNFELRWSKEEALRLVGWTLGQCGLEKYRSDVDEDTWNTADLEMMGASLSRLWGKKLGSDNSREARTSNWILSAVSDFKGNIQARDIIRLIGEASKLQRNKQRTDNRLLSPQAIREALQECGKKKIEEVKTEMPFLKIYLEKLAAEQPPIPISKDKLNEIGIDNPSLLEDQGVLLREGTDYYLPEMYRQGLGLKLSVGARPKVVYLTRKLLEAND